MAGRASSFVLRRWENMMRVTNLLPRAKSPYLKTFVTRTMLIPACLGPSNSARVNTTTTKKRTKTKHR